MGVGPTYAYRTFAAVTACRHGNWLAWFRDHNGTAIGAGWHATRAGCRARRWIRGAHARAHRRPALVSSTRVNAAAIVNTSAMDGTPWRAWNSAAPTPRLWTV